MLLNSYFCYLIRILGRTLHLQPSRIGERHDNTIATCSPYITATVHMRFPQWISSALHHIMEHPAHHLSTNISLYNLRAAQRLLEDDLGNQIVVQQFGFAWYRNCVRTCKLYDFERSCWVRFQRI